MSKSDKTLFEAMMVSTEGPAVLKAERAREAKPDPDRLGPLQYLTDPAMAAEAFRAYHQGWLRGAAGLGPTDLALTGFNEPAVTYYKDGLIEGRRQYGIAMHEVVKRLGHTPELLNLSLR
jgi:hypothetical protein